MDKNKLLSNPKNLFLAVIVFLLPYLFILYFHDLISLNKFVYANEHIYLPDNRMVNKPFNMLNSLATSDAQWFLKIADSGYPSRPKQLDIANKTQMDGLTYAYYPLYPTIISLFNIFIHDISLSAFAVTILLGLLLIISWLFVLGQIFDSKTASRSLMLLLVFPFSIFLRSYFTESLQLILLLWYFHFLHKNKFIWSSFIVALLCLVKGNNLIFISLTGFIIWLKTKNIKHTFVYCLISSSTTFYWITFNLLKTDHAFYFLKARESWNSVFFPLGILTNPFAMSSSFAKNIIHNFHYSIIDSLVIMISGLFLVLMYKKIPSLLWLISFSMWFFPLASSDIMSFSRYQSINFPIFVYLSIYLSQNQTRFFSVVSLLILSCISILFINWYWIG